jgi:hypothetical protein
MPKINLSGMTVDVLMNLRKQIDEILSERRAELEKQLERMGVITSRVVGRGGAAHWGAEKSHQSIEVRQVKPGQGVA